MPWPSSLGVGVTTPPRKNNTVTKPQGNEAGQIPRRHEAIHEGQRLRKRKKLELNIGTWNVHGFTGYRKTPGNWVLEIGGRMPRIEVAGDICLRRPRLSRGCRVDDDDDDDIKV